jgi:hypothetical protein
MSQGQKFYGKYRGTVVNNIDPERRGRLMLLVSDVLTLIPSTWAEACAPLSGPPGPAMGVFLVPPIGAGVWVEFEQGDPDYPIWTGCRWDKSSDLPSAAKSGLPVSPNIVLQSLTQNSITISDVPGPSGGITLTCGASKISINLTGIAITAPKFEIKAAQIKLTGITDINEGALKIT